MVPGTGFISIHNSLFSLSFPRRRESSVDSVLWDPLGLKPEAPTKPGRDILFDVPAEPHSPPDSSPGGPAGLCWIPAFPPKIGRIRPLADAGMTERTMT